MLGWFFPGRAVQWLGPLLAAALGALLIAIAVVVTGIVDLSAAKPHPQGWARLLHYVFQRSTAFHASEEPPADLDTPLRVAAGAAHYGQVCARCHGGPGFGQNPVVMSMRPRPQHLATDLPAVGYSAPELFRIVKAGVKYSAMPSWPVDRRDDEIWHMVAFLRAMPKMSPATFRSLALVQPGQGGAPIPFVVPGTPRRYALRNAGEMQGGTFSYRTPVIGMAGYAVTGSVLPTCARCHGTDGAGGGAFPNLTIQNRDYLARTLTAYATGRRHSGFMQVAATELSPAQIAALADHYSALPRRSTERPGAFPAIGQQLVLTGIPSAGIAACASCHGINRAAARAYPLLEGQSAWYIANQMRLFRDGGRGGVTGDHPDDPMVAIAKRLTDAQIAAVAAYYAAQPPSRVQSFAAVERTR